MRQLIALIILGLSITLNVGAQSYKFDFTSDKKTKDGYIKITSADRYANAKGYGYDLSPSPDGKNHAPFFFSVAVPDAAACTWMGVASDSALTPYYTVSPDVCFVITHLYSHRALADIGQPGCQIGCSAIGL